MIKHLASMHEAPDSISSTLKQNKIYVHTYTQIQRQRDTARKKHIGKEREGERE